MSHYMDQDIILKDNLEKRQRRVVMDGFLLTIILIILLLCYFLFLSTADEISKRNAYIILVYAVVFAIGVFYNMWSRWRKLGKQLTQIRIHSRGVSGNHYNILEAGHCSVPTNTLMHSDSIRNYDTTPEFVLIHTPVAPLTLSEVNSYYRTHPVLNPSVALASPISSSLILRPEESQLPSYSVAISQPMTLSHPETENVNTDQASLPSYDEAVLNVLLRTID